MCILVNSKDNASKRKDITSYLHKYPEFPPGYYELSRLYSKTIIGEQTLDDKKLERENLTKFIALVKQGKFVRSRNIKYQTPYVKN